MSLSTPLTNRFLPKPLAYLLSALLFLGSSLGGFAQQLSCGATEANDALAAQNPAYAQSLLRQKTEWGAYNASPIGNPQARLISGAGGSVSYEIPVVFHIIHTGQAIGTTRNPSDTAIQNLVAHLNAVYSATWAAYPDTNNGGVNIPVQFVLAKRSPTCGTTTGINRVNGSSLPGYSTFGVRMSGATSGAPDTSVKALSIWPNDRYLNIWIVTGIQGAAANGGGVAGYAYYPGASANVDGIVLRYDQTYHSLAHEMGHSMGLRHTFQGSSNSTTCPPNVNCATDGDMVCDTDPHALVTGCPTGFNTCINASYGTIPNNIMNYTNCRNRFSAGQRTRLLFQLLNYRGSLAASLGGLAPGVYPTSVAAPATACVPGALSNPGNQMGVGLGNVSLGTLSHLGGSYDEDSFRHYINHTVNTCMEGQAVGVIAPGTPSTLSVSLGYYNGENARAWIDWNGDGTFQTSEQVLSFSGTMGGQTATATVTAPATALTCTPLRMRVVSDYAFGANNLTACGSLSYGQTEDFTIIVQPTGTQTPAVAISRNGGSTVCANSALTFTATPTNGGTTPSYQWKVNGANVGTNSPTYTASTWATGNTVTVTMTTSNTTCVLSTTTAVSPTLTITTTPAPATPGTISGTVTVCSGTVSTYSVPAVAGLTYNWTLPAGWIGSSTTASISATAGAGSGAIQVTASNTCGSSAARSRNVSATPAPTPALSIAANNASACAGAPVTFTATPSNGGTTPAYQWKVNGSVQGTNSSSFTTTTLANSDAVLCVLTNSTACAPALLTATSNTFTAQITPVVTPVVTLTATPAPPFTAGQTVVFSATLAGGGNSPTIQWLRNAQPVSGANAATWTATAGSDFSDGDLIGVWFQSNAPCAQPDTAQSNTMTTIVTPNSVSTIQAPADFRLYPNPFSNQVTIVGLETGDAMTLLDVTGKTVYRTSFVQGGTVTLRIAGITPGVYWARFVRQNGQQWGVRIVRVAD